MEQIQLEAYEPWEGWYNAFSKRETHTIATARRWCHLMQFISRPHYDGTKRSFRAIIIVAEV